ncbi:inovirus Gp2 family protein [Deefgea tanakiae]|uniref:Inovirus Gp2 family protein n=1 Tax=Deefgea tanakiae TaxID=2865840 RepID=A0ABX8Z7U4_9NEIS|nr:inovirus Gp2 family protein [Deefgea tanakiae]
MSRKLGAIQLSSNELGFDINTNGMGHLQVRPKSLGRLMEQLSRLPSLPQLQMQFPNQEVSPFVRLLLKAVDDQEWRHVPPFCVMSDGCYAGEHFNRTLLKIRKKAGDEAFKKEASIWSGMYSENFTGTMKYVDYLFSRYSKLLVVRLDLDFKEDYPARYDAALCKRHLDTFLNNRRNNSLFEHCVGYVWHIEFGKKMGFHCHCILFFNGNKVQQGVNWADRIGQYWSQKIVGGYGSYHNCNKNIDVLKKLGRLAVGMIHYSDAGLRKNLMRYAVSYLTKIDELIRLQIPEDMPKFRTFGRGEIPKYREVKKRGRPRDAEQENIIN